MAAERARGVTDAAIREALLAQGWKEEDVTASMVSGAVAVAATLPSEPKQYSFGNLFEGRLMRWQSFVNQFFLSLAFAATMALIYGVSYITDLEAIMWLGLLLYVPFVLVSMSLTIRRIHDLNWSGWLCLVIFLPAVGTIFSLVVLFMKGTVGPNKYGPEQGDRNFKNTVLNL